MHRVTNIPIVCINPHLTCKLCNGYLIDATTIVECLHSFCRTCIVQHLEVSTTCPVCDTLLHKTRPHYAIRPDHALQAIVYKLVPGLFEKEMSCRRDFYKDRSLSETRSLSPEMRGKITLNAYVIQEEEPMSIELEYWQPDLSPELTTITSSDSNPKPATEQHRSTYLLCPPDLTVGHLEKLIRVKFELKPGEYNVALFFSSSASTSTNSSSSLSATNTTSSSACEDVFKPSYTLSDLACLYAWRRNQPMKLYFTIVQTSAMKTIDTMISTVSVGAKANGSACPPVHPRVCTTTATSSTPPTTTTVSAGTKSSGSPVKSVTVSNAGTVESVTPSTNHRTRLSLDSSGTGNCPGAWAETVPPKSPYLPSAFANPKPLTPISKLNGSIAPLLSSPTSVCSPRA